jgi:hypothetical protein
MTEVPENKINPAPEPVKVSIIKRIRNWYHALPDKKRYLEFMTALLTIPVLLTVLLSNVSNLKRQQATPTTPAVTPVITYVPLSPAVQPSTTATPSSTPTPGEECVKQIGPIDILYPENGDAVSGDPVCLDIVRQSKNYCSIVWSYRINGGAWSEYTDKSICMYSLTPGLKNLELRVKSIVSSDTTVLTRTFTVASSIPPTPTIATSSAETN